jgi:DNA-3-methyladenine glycosylase II
MATYGDGADAYLSAADPVLAGLIHRFGPLDDGLHLPQEDLFSSLILAATSTRSPRAVLDRLTTRYGGHVPVPAELLADDPEAVRRAAGLSPAMTRALLSTARVVAAGKLDLDRLPDLDDGEVRQALAEVEGLGERSAAVFLIYALHRPDVLATGDPGIRHAARRAYRLDRLPDAATLTAMAAPWRPHRTRACFYLWQSL